MADFPIKNFLEVYRIMPWKYDKTACIFYKNASQGPEMRKRTIVIELKRSKRKIDKMEL